MIGKYYAASFILVALLACGGGSPSTSSARVGAAGGALELGAAGLRLEIPAGALHAEVEIHAHELEPGHCRERQVELEPRGLELAKPARVTFRVDDDAAGHDIE